MTYVRVLVSASQLLASLKNPANVSLLAQQLLTAPALWGPSSSVRRLTLLLDVASVTTTSQTRMHALLNTNPDIPPFRRLLFLAGLVRANPENATLEMAFVRTASHALKERSDDLAQACIAISLTHAFETLSVTSRSRLPWALLLPLVVKCAYFSSHGLQAAIWLDSINRDVKLSLAWSDSCASYLCCREVSRHYLVANLGAVSRLVSFAPHNCSFNLVRELAEFCHSVTSRWRNNRLSVVDTAIPLLRPLLRSILFSVVLILQAVLNRQLSNPHDQVACATMVLQILRDLSSLSSTSFSQFVYVHLLAIDIISSAPGQGEVCLRNLWSSVPGAPAQHPVDRALQLFCLNSTEHLASCLSPPLFDRLLFPVATTFLATEGSSRDLIEAAHSVMLAAFAAPLASPQIHAHLQAYVVTLFAAFPSTISTRQFRIAVKTLVRESTLAAVRWPHLYALVPGAIMELLLEVPQPDTLLAATDCLPYLPVHHLELWLDRVAKAINGLADPVVCQRRFQEVLKNGEMDVPRANMCVQWSVGHLHEDSHL